MSSAAVGAHHHGPLSLMSCVRESSPLQDYETSDNEKIAATKKKFWNPKKWFKRKNKASEDAVPVEIVTKDELRSRSTSELSIADEQIRRRSGSSMHPGLSVSHDSVFHSPNSGSDIELEAAQSSSSLSISQPQIDLRLQTELSERLRLRRGRGDTSEDDEGLPHSPCNSPTTTEGIDKTAIKDLPTKSHSTCSDGSLLSMGSSEMDEESVSHSSKLSLQEKRSSDQDSDLELGPGASSAPLNHSAAHHRVSVRPKRRAPHRNRVPQLSNALPTTPEVNEDTSIRSVTPEHVTRETVTEHFTISTKSTLTETQIKCSSLPPGLTSPDDDPSKLLRSRSSAQDHFDEEDSEGKSDKSFFDRIFPRRSAKKRKSKEDKPPLQPYKRVEAKPIAAPRSGAAARQRILPIDLPPSPDSPKKDLLDGPAFGGTSPLHLELETRFKQRMTVNLTPPPSPKQVESSVIEKRESREETRRMKIVGLSSLQQRVLTLNDETDDDGFRSLTDLPDEKPVKPVTKSHSFKAAKPAAEPVVAEATNERKISASLDSVKNLESYDLVQEIFNDVNSVITVSGPSHTAVVNVVSESSSVAKELSVTKIELKSQVPEFFSKQLNKVEPKSLSNVVFSMNSPRVVDDEELAKVRKFSQEDIEIVEKAEEERPRYRKNESKRKSSTSSNCTPDSPSSDKQFSRSRSASLDSLKTEESDKSSQDSLDKLEQKDVREKSVVLRKKSLMKQKKDEEPELMKVFARRSLKLKDVESEEMQQVSSMIEEAKTRDSDKENQADSPQEERKISKEFITLKSDEVREPLVETPKEKKFIEVAEVTLRKPSKYVRAFSLNPPKVEEKVKKQGSFNERRITENWIKNDDVIESKISQDEIITSLSPKTDFLTSEELLTERNNFNQRKAEWEKRAQEAQKKSVP